MLGTFLTFLTFPPLEAGRNICDAAVPSSKSSAQRTAHMLLRAAGAEVEVAVGLDAALRHLES
jgi:hypothetical protein